MNSIAAIFYTVCEKPDLCITVTRYYNIKSWNVIHSTWKC